MFRNRKTAYESGPADGRAGPVPDDRPDTVAYRPWYGPARALTTLLGAAGAVALIWAATQMNADGKVGEYWAMLGLVALAGLVMALSQLVGGWTKLGAPRISGSVLLLAFVPTLVVAGWILLAHQPDSELYRNDIRGWSDDMGLLGFVMDFENLLPALAFLTGLTFGFSFDTSGPRVRTAVRRDDEVVERPVDGPVAVPAARGRYDEEPTTVSRQVDGPVAVPAARDGYRDSDGDGYSDDDTVVERRADAPAAVPAAQSDDYADEPVTAERRALDEDADDTHSRGFFGRLRGRRDSTYSGTPTAAPRRTDDVD